jgi:cell wall-associated NlpC family hydrolase
MRELDVGLPLDPGGHVLWRVAWVGALVLFLALVMAFALPLALIAGRLAGPQTAAVAQSPAPAQPARGETQGPAPQASQAVTVAQRYLGVPYVFGGTNPAVGLDCSGLTQLVYRQLALELPRTAQQQFDATQRVAPADLQPGDLVFFARTYQDPRDWVTHVGVYVGGGQQINAPTTGQVVSIQPVFTGFWGDHFVSGGRLRG